MKEMTQFNPDFATFREKALALHRSGSVSEAMTIYEVMLKEEPANADVLGLLAMTQHQLGSQKAARTTWLKSLSQQATPPITLRNINNLLTAVLQEDSADERQFLIDLPIPDWPSEPVPSLGERNMIISLARGLLQIGRKPAALKLLENVLLRISDDARFTKNAAEVMLDAGHAERASLLLQSLTAADQQSDGEMLILHAAAALAAGQREDAYRLSARAVEALPVHITTKIASQALLVGVLNQAPKLIEKQVSPQLLHFLKNSPASLAWNSNDAYRFLSIFPEASTARAALQNLPQPDLILNNWVNAETLSTPDTLEFISGFADGLGLPILNHPRKAAETTRQRNAERLSGIPNLVVPRIARFFNETGTQKDLVRAIRNTIGFPVIIRNPFTQMGKEAAKLDTPRQLEKYLDQIPGQELYAIEFVHNPAAEGLYRKFRAAVIGEEIIVYHSHFGRQWNVHGGRDVQKLAELPPEPAAVRFADQIISNPLEALGKAGITALRDIRKRIPLDFYGIDFDVMPDGRLLFFEANAAMNISLSGRKSREAPRAIMRAAFSQLLENTRDRKQRT